MTYIRKSLAVTLIAVHVLLFTFNTASADTGTIYQSTVLKQTITSGATLENIARFTDDGWLNINVLRVDLSNPYIKVDTMSNTDSMKSLTSAKALAESRGAVAAINAGFFNWLKEGGGYPDGPVVESGKIISASGEYNRYGDTMATFSLSNLNEAMYNYWKTNIALKAPNGNTIEIAQYNKASADYTDFTILDRRWGRYSPGVSDSLPDIVEMVVTNGKVAEIRQAQPAVGIPQNGYVVVTRQAGGQTLRNSFNTGDSVSMDISTTPDWSKLKMAVSGSAILVKDGQIPAAFSFNINGRHPRTAVGSSKDGKQLLLVTADGRQQKSIGMTQTEMAQLMLDLGAYNALNLDGGGSTTMAARKPGTDALGIVNSPSDGFPRGVATAIGIFSIAPPSELDGLIIDTVDANVFTNTSRKFTVRGYDRYFNPVEIDQNAVSWSVSGVQGAFRGGTLYPKSVGDGKVCAKLGNITAELDISVLSSPAQLFLSDKSIQLPLNSSETLTVSGKNKNGYHAYIDPADVKWSVKGGVGTFSGNVFTASAQGTGYIDASVGGTHAYCAVSVATDREVLKDGFEKDNGSFLAYPASLTGNYLLSGEQKHSGKTSGKLIYDFTNTEGTRAAYMVYYNGGLALDANTKKLGLWVYNSHANSNWLRAEVYDANNKKYIVEFARNLDWTGWKHVEATLQGIDAPKLLGRIYLVQTSPVSDTGAVYLDDLTATVSSYPSVDMSKLPKDTAPADEAYKSVKYAKTSDSFRFAVFGQSREPNGELGKQILAKLADKTNSFLEACALVGPNRHDTVKLLKKPYISTDSGYKSFDIKSGRFIQLDTSSGGLRTSQAGQWQWLLQQLDTAKGKDIFVFLASSPDNFSDSLEAKLLQDMLTAYRQKTGREVWVFYKGAGNASYMERGVKYISTAGYDVPGLSSKTTDAAKYVLVTVKGGAITFEFKPVI